MGVQARPLGRRLVALLVDGDKVSERQRKVIKLRRSLEGGSELRPLLTVVEGDIEDDVLAPQVLDPDSRSDLLANKLTQDLGRNGRSRGTFVAPVVLDGN